MAKNSVDSPSSVTIELPAACSSFTFISQSNPQSMSALSLARQLAGGQSLSLQPNYGPAANALKLSGLLETQNLQSSQISADPIVDPVTGTDTSSSSTSSSIPDYYQQDPVISSQEDNTSIIQENQPEVSYEPIFFPETIPATAPSLESETSTTIDTSIDSSLSNGGFFTQKIYSYASLFS